MHTNNKALTKSIRSKFMSTPVVGFTEGFIEGATEDGTAIRTLTTNYIEYIVIDEI